MKNFEKQYIGKGKKSQNFGIIDVTIALEKADAFIFEYEGKNYLKFQIAERKEADQFGNTHTVYVNQLIIDASEKPAPVEIPRTRKPRKARGH